MIIHPKAENNFNSKRNLGYLHIYTGEGKGKTSAALGVLLRAAGQNHKVTMIQFLTGDKDRGELKAVQQLGNNVEIIQFGRNDLQSIDDVHSVDAYFASQGLNYAREVMRRSQPDVLILDELITAVNLELVPLADVIDFLDDRHNNIETIITGRDAHPVLLNMADLVTVMESTKHYYDNDSFTARQGIEY
ncbi:MAG: cob(I)yrinic acid a,c-diamide adenosyltransferase [bacterium]|nr:cob(I)yrinic acid a,c-diamide adenosyltransferase [bacterium]